MWEVFDAPLNPVVQVCDGWLGLVRLVFTQVTGDRLGHSGDDVVTLTVFNHRGFAFVSPPCVFELNQERVRCTSPPGVGLVSSVRVTVDGVMSDVFPVSGLAFTAPVVVDIASETSSTTGGRVRIAGRNFGPAALNAVDAVTYAPVGFAIDPRPASCWVSVDDVELTCTTNGGVGALVSA